jgi:hypothetical protein
MGHTRPNHQRPVGSQVTYAGKATNSATAASRQPEGSSISDECVSVFCIVPMLPYMIGEYYPGKMFHRLLPVN